MKRGNFETFLVRDAEYTFGFVYDDKYREEGKRPLSFKLSKQDLKDLHSLLSELLETHTVKEPIGKYSKDTGHLVICSSQSGSPFECHICNPSHTVKEEKRTIWVEEAAYNRGYVTGRTDCEKSHTVAPPSNSEKKIPCLCPAWFQDGKGGWIKNTRKDHVKGECPLANVEEQPTTPEKECCENCNGKKNQSNSISSVCSGHCLCHKS